MQKIKKLSILLDKKILNEQIVVLSKNYYIDHGLYGVIGEDFSSLYSTGSFEYLLNEICKHLNKSYKAEQIVKIGKLE
jgi:hypothetical protein